ncbi:MAG: FeoB-associated Cys-rich membrane protein [Ruminococcus sp.]|nr:FeoB-associated Cys-rich membrane protein [Ruminococcus sp.]
MGTVIAGVIVALIIFMAGRQMYKDKKSGKSVCGGNCASCCGCPHGCGAAGGREQDTGSKKFSAMPKI